jgi:hypothetical protein
LLTEEGTTLETLDILQYLPVPKCLSKKVVSTTSFSLAEAQLHALQLDVLRLQTLLSLFSSSSAEKTISIIQ